MEQKGRYNNYYCEHCKMSGHTIQRCYKLHGYPQNMKNDRKFAAANSAQCDKEDQSNDSTLMSFTPTQYQQLLQLLGKEKNEDINLDHTSNSRSDHVAGTFCLLSAVGSNWIVDSGATDHMCHDLSFFQSYKEITGNFNTITIPDGKQVHITHQGVLKFNNDITLTDVLYVPDFKFNLISIPKLCKDLQCEVVFSDLGCSLQGPLMRPLPLGKMVNGLYYLEDTLTHSIHPSSIHPSCSSSIGNGSSFKGVVKNLLITHLRLGHMPVDKFQYVKNVFNNEKCFLDDICQICPAAKKTRKSFHSSLTKSTQPFQLVHLDT